MSRVVMIDSVVCIDIYFYLIIVNEIMRRRLSLKLRCYQLTTCVGTSSRMLCEWNQDEQNEFIDYQSYKCCKIYCELFKIL